MLLDVLSTDNCITFNISVAHIFGLNAAVYCSELLNIYKKAVKKNKIVDDNFFKLDRKYVFNKTTLTIEEQLQIDSKWMEIGMLKKHKDNPDIIKIDIPMFLSIVSCEDENKLMNIIKEVKVVTKEEVKETKRMCICKNLKDGIECSNYELLTALRNWIDSIFAKPGSAMTKAVVKKFQSTLNEYTKGDLDLALELVNIATIQGYRDCKWAINIYEKDKRIKHQSELLSKSRLPRVTLQEVANKNELSDEVF